MFEHLYESGEGLVMSVAQTVGADARCADARCALDGALASLCAVRGAAAAAASWSHADQLDVLAALERLSAILVAVRSRVLDAVERSDRWTDRGDRDLVAWQARTSRQGAAAALGQVRTARTLASMPAVDDALAGGSLTGAHVETLARVAATASPVVADQLASPDGQAHVLDLARGADARTFATALRSWAARLDPTAVQTDHDAQRAARFLVLTETADGTRVHGRLDRWAGKRVRLALAAVSPRPAADDERSAEQRAADALAALADAALDTPPQRQASERPHVSIVLDAATWAAVRRRGAGAGAGAAPTGTPGGATTVAEALRDREPARDIDGQVVPPSELARLLCDCELSRTVLAADSEVLDQGRTVRLYGGAQRRAVLLRDGGCAWPGCPTPARHTAVHHLTWWDRDTGPTSVANGCALCSFHHHLVHRCDLTLERRAPQPTRRNRRTPAGLRAPDYVIRRRDGTLVTQTDPPDADRTTARPTRPPDALLAISP